jgi:hypothetical protein
MSSRKLRRRHFLLMSHQPAPNKKTAFFDSKKRRGKGKKELQLRCWEVVMKMRIAVVVNNKHIVIVVSKLLLLLWIDLLKSKLIFLLASFLVS